MDVNMVTNDTLGMLPLLTARILERPMTVPATIAIAFVLGFLVLYTLTPSIDPREPSLVKPRIPFVGHIIGMMQHQAGYHIKLQKSTGKPIATLPMLTGKMYAVWDPYLVAAGLRTKSLSTIPHIIDATPVLSQVTDSTTDLLRSPEGPLLVDRMMGHVIPATFKGASLQRLNQTALAELASQLSTLSPSSSSTTAVPIPNAWLWLRSLLTSATSKAIYGTGDPFAADASVEPALWDLEKNLLKLTLNLPSFLVPTGHRARKLLFDALTPYYSAGRDADPSTSDFVRNRAAELRAAGIPDDDVARIEIMLPFAALANTVPLLFWLFGHVFSRPELVAKLRGEVEGLITTKHDGEVGLLVTTAAIEERCPLLMSCYRETLRRTVHQVSTRTAVEDTVLSDRGGRQYLLKKDSVVQLVIGAGHGMEEYWGEDADEFKPERFIGHMNGGRKGDGDDGPGSAKAMKAAFQPFGGGTHLCPGRHFAFTEMMAVMATLLIGYEVEPLEGTKWQLPPFATRSVIDAVTKPARHGEGFGVRIGRRQGWEDVRWSYEL